ncbi:hypothetical protein [Burkholderia multivorans]|uniref:hypothetical protein n=1 Tax=Burkholderia multivorans TaxID=87883 RepID=UPI0020970B61|nr:hypothetical protein [Burkholderia multivorans]MCO7336004.1 hypothetical protein [Burkholderia multivorans]HDR9337721.1 hypothetical protein [Burkholderia multivorans]
MTVTSSQQDVIHVTDGSTTVFSIPFYFISDDSIVADKIDSNGGLTTLINGTDYTVSGAGNESGGALTTIGTISRGFSLRIRREVPVTQETQYQQNSPFPSKSVEQALDKLTMIAQQLNAVSKNAIRYPLGEYNRDGTLPSANARALNLLGFDDSGAQTMMPMPASVGAGDLRIESWSDGVDYVSGTTTSVTLSRNYGTKANVGTVVMDGVAQDPTSYQITGTTLTFLNATGDPTPIPLGVSRIWCHGGTTISLYTPPDSTVTDQKVSVGTKLYSRIGDVVSITDPPFFGRPGLSYDNTAAIAAALAYCATFNPPKRLYFPAGIWMCSRVVFSKFANIIGEGDYATVFRQIPGSNKDFFYGLNSSVNWGTGAPPNSPADFPYGFRFEGFCIDGNYNQGIGNTLGSGLVFWGSRFTIRDVSIYNVAEHGWRSEYIDTDADYRQPFYESTVNRLRIDTTGKHGMWFNGPHDSQLIDVTVLDASQSGQALFDGVYVDALASGMFVGLHPSTRSGSLNMRYALNCRPGSSGQVSGGSQIEGGYIANMNLEASGWIFDHSTRWYANHTDRSIYMGGTNCSGNKIMGLIGDPIPGGPPSIGIVFSEVPGDSVNNNRIDVEMTGQGGAAIAFGTQDKGANDIRISSYNNPANAIYQSPHPSTRVQFASFGSGGPTWTDTHHQTTNITVPANGSAKWTFPFPFPIPPAISLAPINPGAAITTPPWTSGAPNTTDVTVFNPNSIPVTVCIKADVPTY